MFPKTGTEINKSDVDCTNSELEIKQAEDPKRETSSTKHGSKAEIGRSSNDHGLLTGIFCSCLKPICGIFARKDKIKKDSWIIPFNALTEIRLIGSGAQGAVFLGHYKNEEVAIKKVKNERDTDIRHLKHLDHKNIVKFR